jgi:hypothetical protein
MAYFDVLTSAFWFVHLSMFLFPVLVGFESRLVSYEAAYRNSCLSCGAESPVNPSALEEKSILTCTLFCCQLDIRRLFGFQICAAFAVRVSSLQSLF